MSFHSVTYFNYRNIENGTINFPTKEIFLVGKNGQGKTNILESIYILAYGASFKRKSEQVFKTYGSHQCSIIGKFNIENDENNEIRFTEEKNRQIFLNRHLLKDRKDLINLNPVVLFSHEDFNIITGEPELRRKYIDQMICFDNCEYIDLKRNYKLLLGHRNALLKEKNIKLLGIYDKQIAHVAFQIYHFRKKLTEEINNVFSKLYSDVVNQDISIRFYYQSSLKGKTEEEQIKEIEESRYLDLKMNTTTKGPHRDNFIFVSDNKDFSKTASTGQKRILSLILKLLQAKYVEKTGKKPIILLDDVILEVDGEKRSRFLKKLDFYEQIFYAFLPGENYKEYIGKETTVLFIDKGKIYEK